MQPFLTCTCEQGEETEEWEEKAPKLREIWQKFPQINGCQTDQYHNLVEFRETGEMSRMKEILGNFPEIPPN
jgi:hypothetical protein